MPKCTATAPLNAATATSGLPSFERTNTRLTRVAVDHLGDGAVLEGERHNAHADEVRNLEARRGQLLGGGVAELQRAEADLRAAIGPRTRLLAIGAASNALGTVNDLALARRLATAVGAWLLVDAVHYAAHFPVDVQALDCDFLLCSAYKFYGPHIGLLYARPGLLDTLRTDKLSTQDDAAPFRIETGTLNHAALAGVKAAIEFIASWGEGETLRERIVSAMTGIASHEHAVAAHYHDTVRQIPGVRVWGPDFSTNRRAPTVSITVDGVPARDVARHLGDAGLQVWDGHFYAQRAIETLGLAEKGGVVRTGVCMYNTREEIERLVEEIERLTP